jgi:sugar phosphate isomerase/epimerase
VTNQLCVSSFSLRRLLGPVRMTRRGPDGTKQAFTWGDEPGTMTLLALPGQVRERLGLDAVEICQFHVPERTDAYLDDLKGALDAAGVSVVNMPIDVGNISDPNERHREEDLAEIEEWMRAAARVGSSMVRVNASAFGAGELAPLEVTIASYRRLGDTAKALGMQLLIENHGGVTDDFDTIVRIVEEVGLDRIKTLIDVGNHPAIAPAGDALLRGKEPPPVDPTPLYADLPKLVPYAGLLHAKTWRFHPDGRPTIFDVGRALRVVREAGYAGPISLENEGGGDDAWGDVRRTRRLVDEAFA